MTKYREVAHYEEWLAGQHGGHKSYQRNNYLYCDECKLKFRTGVSEEQANKVLKRIKSEAKRG